LAPVGDGFIKEKLGVEAWPLANRARLCEIASGESEWISVCSWGEFRSYRLCSTLREYLVRDVALKGHGLTGIEVMGSDTAIGILDKNIADWDATDSKARDFWYPDRVVCCVPRPGSDSAAAMHHIEKHTARRVVDLGVEFILLDPHSFGPALEPVSSTEIRQLLAAGDFEGLRAQGWLHPQVLSALAHEGPLEPPVDLGF
jgi:hypothetical protein